MTAEVTETETYYTVNELSKQLGINYQRIVYAIAKKWLIPAQYHPMVLITRSEALRYAETKNIPLPENF